MTWWLIALVVWLVVGIAFVALWAKVRSPHRRHEPLGDLELSMLTVSRHARAIRSGALPRLRSTYRRFRHPRSSKQPPTVDGSDTTGKSPSGKRALLVATVAAAPVLRRLLKKAFGRTRPRSGTR